MKKYKYKKRLIGKKRQRKDLRCRKPTPPMRVSPEFRQLINQVRATYLLKGRTPPSISKITDMIAKKIDKDEMLKNEFIRF